MSLLKLGQKNCGYGTVTQPFPIFWAKKPNPKLFFVAEISCPLNLITICFSFIV